MKKTTKKAKKERLSFKRTISNNIFALKAICEASPWYFIIAMLSSLVGGLLEFVTGSYLLREIINGIEAGKDIDSIAILVLIIGVVCCIVYGLTSYFWWVKAPGMRIKIASNIEKKLFLKASRVELSCYENPSFYDKYVKAMDEAYNRLLYVINSSRGLISRIITLLANSLLLFIIDPVLIIFAAIPFIFSFFRRLENVSAHNLYIDSKPIERRTKYIRRVFYLGEWAKEIRVGGMYGKLLRELENSYNDFKAIIKKHGFKQGIYAFIQTMGLEVITILGATLYSVWSTMCIGSEAGGMQVGDCLVVLGSIGSISYCLNNLVQNVAEFGEHALFLEDVRYFLEYEPKIKDGDKKMPQESGDLVVKDLCFRYDGCDHDTLKNINFTLHKGERIALVGSNGSGKTTLVKLLMRLYDADSGSISLGDDNIKDFAVSDWQNSFSTVFQDFKMFSMSVRDNVLMRKAKEGDDELVTEALKQSGIWDKISSLENGIDTILTREFDDSGVNLSVGEAQKLSLARIFLSNSPFVILDEPSSALDPIAEYQMFENMIKATEGRSVIFISHRLSSAVLADRVILLDDGQIAEIGTHTELLNKNGKYAEMFKRQAENYLGNEVTANA